MPELFRSYELIKLLGEGGMGVVWEAIDTRNQRRVALKLLPPNLLSDPDLQERFRRECKFAMSVENQHVLPVYEAEVNGQPFIAMRLIINGTNLASEINRRPLGPERAVAIVEQVAAALTAAHGAGLRHRDVTPSNILLEPGARTGTDHAWLFDWGIAQSIDISHAPVTRMGNIVGTPAYIAPERLQGSESDHRADVYSLAVVLYECLAGRRPFENDDEGHLLLAHLHAKPPQLPSHVPAALRAVVAKGLEKKPADRYQSARAFAEAAREALDKSDGWVAHVPKRLVTGAASGSLVALTMLLLGWIDGLSLAWILPALATAAGLLAWAIHPWAPARPVPRPSDQTRDTWPGGVPPRQP